MTPSETHTDQREETAAAEAPAADAPVETPAEAATETAAEAPAETATEPAEAPPETATETAAEAPPETATETAAEAPAETATEPAEAPPEAAAEAPEPTPAPEPAAADTPSEPPAETAEATAAAPAEGAPTEPTEAAPAAPDAPAPRPAKPPRRSRQADRRKQLEEQSRATAAALGREPERRVIEKAVLAAGGPDAVREFLATPQESREGKPLGWRIACLREARRHESGGKTEEGWVTLSAVPVRQIRGTLDRAVVEDGRISFRDEAPDRRGGRGGPRRGGDRRPGGRDERAVADQFMEGGVASFGGESSGKRNPFSALDGLLEDDKKD